ncbi:MAG TPA: DMT family transporter [Rhizobacter sp.]|nr:DMT family transporter [Rhizobacter sp.]
MPVIFVLIWSTGFIVARYGMPYAPPIKFLCLRYALSALCLCIWALWSRAAWPQGRRQWKHLGVTGCLMHAGYLAGVWSAVKAGMGAGTIALLVSLQPVLTAVWLSFTAARVLRAQWVGLALGFAGLIMVVWHKLQAGEVTTWNLSLAVFALLSITIGTLYQKRFVEPCDVRTASAVQLSAALLVSMPLLMLETENIVLHPHFIGAMVWSVFVLTLGGSSLLYLLIQRGAATQVTSLLYMVPPTTAGMAWVLFGEPLTLAMLAGTALTAAGVALVIRSSAR